MLINEDEVWKYNYDWSWTANREDWIRAVNDERRKYNEDTLPLELANSKFEEYYPQKEYDKSHEHRVNYGKT
tara:strand:+ start:861 stop:1076 length:216 start_codon:yes stop_codon:yes gene_type:complete